MHGLYFKNIRNKNSGEVKAAPPVEDVPVVVDSQVQKSAPPRALERRKSRDNIVFKSGWRKTVRLQDLIRAKVIKESRVVELEEEVVS